MPLAGLEPLIPATKRSQTYVLDRVVTGIGNYLPTSNYLPTNPHGVASQKFNNDKEILLSFTTIPNF
jgi:hypothetical protein